MLHTKRHQSHQCTLQSTNPERQISHHVNHCLEMGQLQLTRLRQTVAGKNTPVEAQMVLCKCTTWWVLTHAILAAHFPLRSHSTFTHKCLRTTQNDAEAFCSHDDSAAASRKKVEFAVPTKCVARERSRSVATPEATSSPPALPGYKLMNIKRTTFTNENMLLLMPCLGSCREASSLLFLLFQLLSLLQRAATWPSSRP